MVSLTYFQHRASNNMNNQRSQKFIDQALKKVIPVFEFLFKCKVTGVDQMKQDQQYICIANHNIGVLIEGFTLLNAWQKYFKPEHLCFAMAHRFFFLFPVVKYVMSRLGCIPANHDSADEILQAGHSMLVFPGGNYECIRTYFDREQCDFNQRKGWVKIALKYNLDIVPIAITGSHSVNPVFYRSQFLSYLLILPKLFHIKWFPISLVQVTYSVIAFFIFKLFLPLWLVCVISYFVYLFAFLIPILPAKIRMNINTPVRLSELNKTGQPLADVINSPEFLQICYDHVSQIIQQNMDQMNRQPN